MLAFEKKKTGIWRTNRGYIARDSGFEINTANIFLAFLIVVEMIWIWGIIGFQVGTWPFGLSIVATAVWGLATVIMTFILLDEGDLSWYISKRKFEVFENAPITIQSSYINHENYKRAIEDCWAEKDDLKDNFLKKPWNEIFEKLNFEVALTEKIEQEKAAKTVSTIVRPDYVDYQKTLNDLLQGNKEPKAGVE